MYDEPYGVLESAITDYFCKQGEDYVRPLVEDTLKLYTKNVESKVHLKLQQEFISGLQQKIQEWVSKEIENNLYDTIKNMVKKEAEIQMNIVAVDKLIDMQKSIDKFLLRIAIENNLCNEREDRFK